MDKKRVMIEMVIQTVLEEDFLDVFGADGDTMTVGGGLGNGSDWTPWDSVWIGQQTSVPMEEKFFLSLYTFFLSPWLAIPDSSSSKQEDEIGVELRTSSSSDVAAANQFS